MMWSGASIAALAAFLVPGSAHAEIVIGVAGPLSGPNAWLGEMTQWGVEAAVARVNESGGLLGQDLRTEVVDDFCQGDQAVAAATKLVADGVALVVGHQCSGAAIPASAVYERAGVLMITNGATNPEVTERGLTKVFRIVGRDDLQGRLAADYLAERWGDGRIAIVHDGQAYGKGLADETVKHLQAKGIQPRSLVEIEPGATDYTALINELQSSDIDVVYFGGYAPEAGLILRQLRDASGTSQFIVSDGVGSEDFWLVAGAGAEGTLMTFHADPRENAEAQTVVSRFRAEGYEPQFLTLYAYAAVEVWAEAVERAGTLDADPVAATLREGTFETVLGEIGFDEKGDLTGYDPFAWYVWKSGDYLAFEQPQ